MAARKSATGESLGLSCPLRLWVVPPTVEGWSIARWRPTPKLEPTLLHQAVHWSGNGAYMASIRPQNNLISTFRARSSNVELKDVYLPRNRSSQLLIKRNWLTCVESLYEVGG